jgi:hypothetical protein
MSINYERSWKQLWINNLKEVINQNKIKEQERQKYIDEKYFITKNDILMFLKI